VTDAGENDILTELAYSAKDASTIFSKDSKINHSKKIMRIHIYDKQVNSYKVAAQLLRAGDGSGLKFAQLPSTDYAKQFAKSGLSDIEAFNQTVATEGSKGQAIITEFKSSREVKDLVSQFVPTITFGTEGSTVVTANLVSKAEPLLSTVNMMRSNTVKNTAAPNGSGEGGIPLRVIPASLTAPILGCPLINLAQTYFIDFNTGTSCDGMYIVTGLTHTIAAGKFETSVTFGFADGYGVFEGAANVVDQIKNIPTT
jgi:hypothetical protein